MPIDPNTGMYVDPLGTNSPGGMGSAGLTILSNMLATNLAASKRQTTDLGNEHMSLENERLSKDQQDEDALRAEISGLGPNATEEDYSRAAMHHGSAANIISGAGNILRTKELAQVAADRQAAAIASTGAKKKATAARLFTSFHANGSDVHDSAMMTKGVMGSDWDPDVDAFINTEVAVSPEFTSKDNARKDLKNYREKMASAANMRAQAMKDKAAKVQQGKAPNGQKFKMEMALQRQLVSLDTDIKGLGADYDQLLASDPRKARVNEKLEQALQRHMDLSQQLKDLDQVPDDPMPNSSGPNNKTPPPASVNTATVKSGAKFRYDPQTNQLVPIAP